MSQKVEKKTSLTKLEKESDSDTLITETSSYQHTEGDFVWVENVEITPCEVTSCEDYLENDIEADAETDNKRIAQYGANSEDRAITEEYPWQCNEETAYDITTPSEWEKGLSVEQQYWRSGPAAKHAPGPQPKHPASQRLTMREHSTIDITKRRETDPSHFKFDYATTVLLKTLHEQHHAGPYHNIIGKGINSVVIYAKYPKIPYSRHNHRTLYYGVAVKVYKLNSDVVKNNAILKRVQKEYAHLTELRYQPYIPNAIHKMRNVIITQFIGEDQETAPNISFLPSGYCRDMYQLIINEMEKWYKKFNLVHGKLGKKNIVIYTCKDHWYGLKHIPYFLSWSHSVKTDHPQALVKLLKDCQFVTNFFKNREVPVITAEELYKKITDFDEISNTVLDAMHKKDLWQRKHLTNPNRAS